MNDISYFTKGALVNDNDELEGAYFARVTSEFILVLKEDLPRLRRARLFKEAAGDLLKSITSIGIKSAHLFVTPESDSHHVEVLKKHFGFVETTGKSLYWEIE